METIRISVRQDDVYEEVAKATDYTGSKLIDSDEAARDRILASDDDLAGLGRFWTETISSANESLKEMLVSGCEEPLTQTGPGGKQKYGYFATIEVSKSFDKALTESVQSLLRSYFISSIIGQWFKFANKGEAEGYFIEAGEFMTAAERLLYSRRKPTRPPD